MTDTETKVELVVCPECSAEVPPDYMVGSAEGEVCTDCYYDAEYAEDPLGGSWS